MTKKLSIELDIQGHIEVDKRADPLERGPNYFRPTILREDLPPEAVRAWVNSYMGGLINEVVQKSGYTGPANLIITIKYQSE
ncbi:MAG: hypothetical protein HYX24_02535 [Candidatus Aenigmarchaeota archaeon]|nr:hypothetical protein [Candidatus Aenigmarchaeota archaeon]